MPKVQIPSKLLPILTTPKRLKLAVGGRGGGKSIAFGDAWLNYCDMGERLCCAREFLNSIDDSVHAMLRARMRALDVQTLAVHSTKITSESGGEIFHKGLARNPDSIKSMFGVKRLWIEEGQTISDRSLDLVMPTIREGDSEIWISMNRGASKDPISQRLLKPYEKHLTKWGFYEDDDVLLIQINHDENPFFPDVLEQERKRDKELMTPAKYRHIWEGDYSDTVEDAIIEPEWFDACIDAHKVLGFKPQGVEVVSHDPSGTGEDDKGLAHRHGSVFLDVLCKASGDVDEGVDWATEYAASVKADSFIYDAGGMGAGIKRQVSDNFKGKKIAMEMFNGASTADHPDAVYEPVDGEVRKAKTNKETFFNKRAQYYWNLRDRCFKTYLAVKKGQGAMFHHDDLISFCSEIENLDLLRSEVCTIPKKPNGAGRIQILSKDEMKKKGIESPNMADSVMMALASEGPSVTLQPINFKSLW